MYSDSPSKETDTFKKFLIAEHLYALGDYAYNEMKETQENFRFYVPERDKLLEYNDQFYYETHPSQINLTNFLQTDMHLDEELACGIVDEWMLMLSSFTGDDRFIEYSLERLRDMPCGRFTDFKDLNQANKFAYLYADMFNHSRLPMYRGLTPIEANEAISPEVYEK